MTETGNDAKKREALSVDELADKVREIAAIIHTDEFHEESHELERLADEIKAAWKRERDELIYAYDPTKAGRGRLPDGSAYALEAMREPVTGCHAVGNAAALREALVVVRKDLWEMMGSSSDSFRERKACDMSNRIRAALSAPARNCDRFNTVREAAIAFAAEYQKQPHPCPDFIFSRWLLATAADQKGETK